MKIEPARGAKVHTRYKLADGTQVPGTTTVLGLLDKGYGLKKWLNDLGLAGYVMDKYVDAQAVVGTLAHYLIECELSGKAPYVGEYSDEEVQRASNSVSAFHAWRRQQASFEVVLSDAKFVSEQYRYGGTIDLLANVNGRLRLVDLKTSNAIYDEHLLQVAAYRQLLEEAGIFTDEVGILQISREAGEGYTEKVIPDTELYFKEFFHALAIYNIRKQRKGEFKNAAKTEAKFLDPKRTKMLVAERDTSGKIIRLYEQTSLPIVSEEGLVREATDPSSLPMATEI